MSTINSLYIHIPYCLSKCRYCDFFSITCKTIPDSYINGLCNEIIYRLKENSVKELKTIYIGGGTPSLLSYTQLQLIIETIRKICVINCTETTIELNPDDISDELLTNLYNLGINRVSCGIQSMKDVILEYAGRRASRQINIKALTLLKKWKGTLSLDLICGLPEETEESFINGLREIISYNPHHISMYSLTIEDETPFGIDLHKGILNYDFEFSDSLWLQGKKILEQNGYNQYEVSNFSLKGFECKHNLSYWQHKNYLGCGSGATGTIYTDDGAGYRWSNSTDIKKYTDYWNNVSVISKPQTEEIVSIDDSIFEFFMMGLRTLKGVNKSTFESIFNKTIPVKIQNEFEKWANKGLCIITQLEDDVNYTLGSEGILFLNKFLEAII